MIQRDQVRLKFAPGRAQFLGDAEAGAPPAEIWEIEFTAEYGFKVEEMPFSLMSYTDAESGEVGIGLTWVTEPFAFFDAERRVAISAKPAGGEIQFVVDPPIEGTPA